MRAKSSGSRSATMIHSVVVPEAEVMACVDEKLAATDLKYRRESVVFATKL